ncbi:unnamed protein product, partial [Mycena citricolor]
LDWHALCTLRSLPQKPLKSLRIQRRTDWPDTARGRPPIRRGFFSADCYHLNKRSVGANNGSAFGNKISGSAGGSGGPHYGSSVEGN